jgi:hypothetical protein
MMAGPPEERAAAPTPTSPGLVAFVPDASLDWVRADKGPRIYELRDRKIQRFLDAIPPALTIDDLKPIHATRAMDAPD